MTRPSALTPEQLVRLGGFAALLIAIATTAQYSYVLFHSLVEISRIVAIFGVAALAWNVCRRIDSPFLLVTGLAYPALGLLELLHTLSYKGMGIFPADANVPTQFWIALRAYESIAMLIAAGLLARRHLPTTSLALGFLGAGGGLAWAVLSGRFPDCFIEGSSLTDFKIAAEYVIVTLFALTFGRLWRQRRALPADILPLLLGALACDILAELAFTQYASVYDAANLVGHLLLLTSAYCIYRALLLHSIEQPLHLLFHQLHAEKERLTKSEAELKRVNTEIKQAQSQLLQSEKMASIGQLAAGIAHEINNPVGFVSSNLGSLQRYLDDLLNLVDAFEQAEPLLPAEAPQTRAVAKAKQRADLDFLKGDVAALLKESLDGVSRVKRIVQDLKDFSHVDDLEWQGVDLNAGLESTLNVVWNELKYKADVVKDYGELPLVTCMAAQLNQVFMNLLVNAAQAIEQHGTITLRTGSDAQSVWVEVADTGKGIAPEHLSQIFEPFFTTKPVGKGTGLGLSISYNIVKKHGGTLAVESAQGEGTTFRVTLPRLQPAQAKPSGSTPEAGSCLAKCPEC